MDNFNLKKFLIENKMTRNSRLLAENIEYIVDNGTEIDQRKFLQHFYNLLQQAGYKVPEHVKDDIDETYWEIDNEYPLSYYQNFSLEDAKKEINDLIDAAGDDPYYADYESVEDFKNTSVDLDKKYQEKVRRTNWEYQYDGDEKVVRGNIWVWDPQIKKYKYTRPA